MTRGKTIALCAFAAALCSAAGVFWGSQKLLKATHETVVVSGLPKKLDGLRILQISDLHARSTEYIGAEVWERARDLEFDIVAMTGDIVDWSARQIEPHLPHIASLASGHPVFFAEGNHDHYSMWKLRTYLEEAGVTVLADEKAECAFNGETFEVAGLSDYYTADMEISASLFTESDKFRLALVHQPQHVDYVDIDTSPCLVLSGHTHGGQWRAPFLPTLYAPGQGFLPKYGHGEYSLNESGSAKMYVSKGIGSTGKVPFRIWNRPEICVITLTSEE